MELKNIVVHYLDKEVDSDPKPIKAEKELPIDVINRKFAERIKDKYYKRQPIYGVFNDDTDIYFYQTYVEKFLSKKLTFLEFSVQSLYILNREIKKKRATGGYVVFLHLEMKGKAYMAVAMIHNTERFNINKSLEVQELLSLDIEQLDIAHFLNITKWQDPNRDPDDTYLSFQKGKKDIREFFTEFIGCTNKTTAKKSSENLKRALYDFLKTSTFKEQEKKEIRSKVYDYCKKQTDSNLELNLEAISNIVNPEDSSSFKNFAASEEYQVNSLFYGNSAVLKQIQFAKYKKNGITIEFDKTLLGKTIFYNEEKGQLLFKQLPSDLLK